MSTIIPTHIDRPIPDLDDDDIYEIEDDEE
jgi:hypothetical protein